VADDLSTSPPAVWELTLLKYSHLVERGVQRYRERAAGLELEDLRQEGRLGLLQALQCHEPASGQPFEPLANRCIRMRIIDAVRTSWHWRKRLRFESASVAADDDGADECSALRSPEAPRERYNSAEVNELLAAVECLPAPERLTVRLRFGLLDDEAWSVVDIAQGMQVSESAVRQRLAAGLVKIRELLEGDGLSVRLRMSVRRLRLSSSGAQ